MRMVHALIVQPDGVGVEGDVDPRLDSLQAVVEGPLEMVSLNGCHLYCDEEGKLKGAAPNVAATLLARALGWRAQDVLGGPVIFLSLDADGDEADVPSHVLDLWQQLMAEQT